METLTGSTPDISMVYRFVFWDEVYFARDESEGKQFPSTSNEEKGRFVGFSETIGHGMTYQILTEKHNKIIFRSRIRDANIHRNLRIDSGSRRKITSTRGQKFNKRRPMAIIDPTDLIGRTYLSQPDETGGRERVRIVETLNEREAMILEDPDMIRFRCVTEDGMVDEIKTYNQILDTIEDHDDEEGLTRFNSIDGHYGPLKKGDIQYKGSTWNVKVNWEGAESTYEPLKLIAESDPITCALYADKNNLLNLPG